MATIEDVAKLAGLSRSTVSRVINNHPYVTEKKRQLVYDAMRQLEYHPNSSAQRLRTQKTNTIAVLVPRLTNPFFPLLVEGLEEVAVENGFQLLICQTQANEEKELSFLHMLTTKQVDGLIFTSIENEWSTVEPYMQSGPMVLCNEYKSEANVSIVRLDQVKGSYLGTQYLIDKGHKAIAYCGATNSELGRDREKGFIQALAEAGLSLKKEWYFDNLYSIDCGKRVLRTILAMDSNERPTAVFTGSDEVAAGIMKEARQKGLSIPKDIAVIGFDDQPIAELLEPSLTTIRQPTKDMGRRTMEVMLSMLANEQMKHPYERKIVELPIELIKRESV
ncbi:LacI family DNA-binding transcriptional regulator [Halalkalibacter sp. APA_J-10(15)]|uniref:LacI family DNA-binding transcriptional regulator n=1 Tax=unclassified Halalkalibacter TaxID=2893063 RepID=UPI001FF55D2F|nr:LacI family DNA-binding transcriptional regulator [Halalkalibacter sp. APA_J-10(15)]MCK0470299.1 LacI family transcriptional regulator [Halalkalibacter sp. APA_J-10(15)]